MGDGPSYRWDRNEKPPRRDTKLTRAILHELGRQPLSADELAPLIGFRTNVIERRLRQLEHAGLVVAEKLHWYHLMTDPEDQRKLAERNRLIVEHTRIRENGDKKRADEIRSLILRKYSSWLDPASSKMHWLDFDKESKAEPKEEWHTERRNTRELLD